MIPQLEGVRVPGWAVGAIIATAAVVTTTYVAAQKMGSFDTRITVQESKTTSIEQRLQRIEEKQDRALELLRRGR